MKWHRLIRARTALAIFVVGGGFVVLNALSREGAAPAAQEPTAQEPGTQAPAAPEPAVQETASAASAVAVRTIQPKCDPNFTLSVKAPAEIEPYEAADLQAQVAGRVEFIRKAQGSKVAAGELLIKVAVPDLDQAVLEKESVVRQRQAELKLAQANERIAQSALTVASKQVEVASSEIQAAQATEEFRARQFRRFSGLVADRAATPQLADEQERAYRAASADTARSRALVLRAQADVEEAQAKLSAAKADVELKAELIDVAGNDRERAKALAGYARITAPFDGVVTRRSIDPGSFVQNASTAHSEPLLRVERRDIVTVSMHVPDTFAPYVSGDTEAVIEMSELPGREIRGRVTRFSPTLESSSKDHTMLVEVDLFNGDQTAYDAFLAKEKAKKAPFDDLKEGPLPIVPQVSGAVADTFPQLYPGMVGDMKLIFRRMKGAYLIPSDAIVRQGGTPYLYLVKAGKATLVPVDVQVDDQRLARVALIERTANGLVKHELTGQEEVVYSNQGELSDGQAVKPIPQEWKP